MKVEVETDYATIVLEMKKEDMVLADWIELMEQALRGLGYHFVELDCTSGSK